MAAGKGTRFNSRENKPYVQLCGRPVLYYSLLRFARHPAVSRIVLVVAPDRIEYCRRFLVGRLGLRKVSGIVAGGDCRQESVLNGLRAACQGAGGEDLVLIHDGARPLVSGALITRVLAAAARTGAAVPGLVPKATVKVVDGGGRVVSTPDRSRLREIQTPQAFRLPALLKAYARGLKRLARFTDDAAVFEHGGGRVQVVEGEESNGKITTPADIRIAALLLRGRG